MSLSPLASNYHAHPCRLEHACRPLIHSTQPFSSSPLPERGEQVLLIETGEDEHLNPLTRWGYFFPSGSYSHLYRNYFTEPEPRVNNRRLYHQAAKALGGGTAVNAMGKWKALAKDGGMEEREGKRIHHVRIGQIRAR